MIIDVIKEDYAIGKGFKNWLDLVKKFKNSEIHIEDFIKHNDNISKIYADFVFRKIKTQYINSGKYTKGDDLSFFNDVF